MHDISSVRDRPEHMSWRQAEEALEFAEQTGLADADAMELAALVIVLDRALSAWQQSR
jgi:hypothetical protein